MDDIRWSARLQCNTENDIQAHVGKRQFRIGRAVDFDDASDQVSAFEYVLAAVGADLLSCIAHLARKRRLSIQDLEASVQGELNNPLMYLGVVGETGDPGMRRLRVRVFLSSSASDAEIQTLWQDALARSPLANTFSALIEFDPSFKCVF
ncbi:MAG: OsmC family protein [Bdellovibrionota bacterium]